MPNKKTVDHKETWASFVLDFRRNLSWSGEIEYGSRKDGRKRESPFECNSVAAIQLSAPLGYTNSKKIDVGATVNLIIYIKGEADDSEFIGFADKRKGVLNVVTWIPWREAMFFHQILISNQCEMLEISGTDLYRSKASIRRVGISGKYDLDD